MIPVSRDFPAFWVWGSARPPKSPLSRGRMRPAEHESAGHAWTAGGKGDGSGQLRPWPRGAGVTKSAQARPEVGQLRPQA